MTRFKVNEVARLPLGGTIPLRRHCKLVILRGCDSTFNENRGWSVTALLEYVHGWTGFYTVKENTLTKVIWTFVGFVDKPSEQL